MPCRKEDGLGVLGSVLFFSSWLMDDSPLYLSPWAPSSSQILNHNVCVHLISDTVANYVLIEVMQSVFLTD